MKARAFLTTGALLVSAAAVGFCMVHVLVPVEAPKADPPKEESFLPVYLPDLSEEQKEEFEARGTLFQERVAGLKDRIQKERAHLGELLLEAEPDTAEVDQQVKLISDLQGQLEREVVTHLLSMRETLTPEQVNRLLHVVVGEMCPEGTCGCRGGCGGGKRGGGCGKGGPGCGRRRGGGCGRGKGMDR
jgi:Spy/CpxP family protein refolding chaperone